MHQKDLPKLQALLQYDPLTGHFYWRSTRRGRALKGVVAGTIIAQGYVKITCLGRKFLAHRLAWLFVYGRWPSHQIDHVNRVKTDNRIANLREATNAQNHHNMPVRRDNRAGVTGVCWNARNRNWRAYIVCEGKQVFLGGYATKEEAVAARRAAALAFHSHNPERELDT